MAFRTKRQRRYQKLLGFGLLPFEARELSSIPFARATFLKDLIRDRRKMLVVLRRQAKSLDWSKTEYENEKRRLVAYEYAEKGLLYTKMRGRHIIKLIGRPDPWQLFRYYKEKAIEKGEWEETPRYKRKKRYDERDIRIDKGRVQEQKARWREKQRRKRESR
jgi:hypothetical protein